MTALRLDTTFSISYFTISLSRDIFVKMDTVRIKAVIKIRTAMEIWSAFKVFVRMESVTMTMIAKLVEFAKIGDATYNVQKSMGLVHL